MRVIEQHNWKDSGVLGLDGEPMSQSLIDKSIEQVEEAVGLQKLDDTENTNDAVFAKYARALVHQALGSPGSQKEFESILEQLELCDRDDLYLSVTVTIHRIVKAVSSGNAAAFREYLPSLQDMLNLGEYGRLFYDGWWKFNYQHCIKSDPWKTIFHEFANGNLKPEGYKEVSRPTVHRNQSSVKDTNTSAQPVKPASSTAQASRSVPAQTASQEKPTATTPSAPLKPPPAGWQRKVTGNGQAYFFNHNTKTCHWAKWQDESGDCELRFADNGRPYILNHTTNTQKWFDPQNAVNTVGQPQYTDSRPISRVLSVPASFGRPSAIPAQHVLRPAMQPPAHVGHSSHGSHFAEQLAKMVVKEVVKDVVDAEFKDLMGNSGGGW